MRYLVTIVMLEACGLAVRPAVAAELIDQRVYAAARARGAFLGRGAGARAAAMGGAYTGLADGAAAAGWNPGGLGQTSAVSAFAQHEAASDGRGLSGLAAAMPVGELVGSLAVSAQAYGELIRRDANGDVAGTESPVDVAATSAWAIANPGMLGGWSGVAVEFVQESRGSALLGFSVGSLVPLSPELTAGWALLHVGPEADGGRLPGAFRAGSSWVQGPLAFATDFAYGITDHQLSYGVGAEYRVRGVACVRAGWRGEGRAQIAGSGGLTGGIGIRHGSLALDYAFAPFGDLATTHRISLEYRASGAPRPRRLPSVAPPPAAAAVSRPAAKRKEPTVKVMPALAGPADDGESLKGTVPPRLPGSPAVPLRREVPTTATPVSTPATRSVPSGDTTPEPPVEEGPRLDPLLPPPAELESPRGEDEGLRDGRRGGASRPGAGAVDDSADAPLRGGR